jgi:hypothetical protein
MTRDQIRRKYIVSTPDNVTEILRQTFAQEDHGNAGNIFDRAGFITYFTEQNYRVDDADDAWMLYQSYRHELAKYEPT